MAKVKGGLHSDSVGGAFGESMIFRKGKKSTTVTGYYKPGSAKKFDLSYPQLANRDKYGQIVQAWKALTTEQQEVFNENAKGTEMSGWNLFMKTYGESMGFKIPLSIDPTKVGGAMTDFAVYINLALLGDHFWAHVKNGGGDIRIKMLDGTECPLEVVSCDTTAKSGCVWAKLPTVSNTIATTFYILYGDITKNAYGVTETYGRNNVWGSSAKYIAHFQTNANDSSASGNNGIVTTATLQNGVIGKAYQFAGGTDKILVPAFTLGQAWTVKIWIKSTTFTNTQRPIIKRSGNVGLIIQNTINVNNIKWLGYGGDGVALYSQEFAANYDDLNKYTLLVLVYNGTRLMCYKNGVYHEQSSAFTYSDANIATTIGGTPFVGFIDEVRIFNSAISPTIFLSDYNNQLNPSTFYAIGSYTYAKY